MYMYVKVCSLSLCAIYIYQFISNFGLEGGGGNYGSNSLFLYRSAMYHIITSFFNGLNILIHIQGGPERTQHLRSIIPRKQGGRKKLCALMRLEFFSQQNDTKISNFDEGVLILWPFFWGNVIFKICHFCLKSHNWRTTNFHCLALALKNEDSMNKEKHSLRN